MAMLDEKLEGYEDSVDMFDGEVESLRTDLGEQFSSFQSGIIEQFTEASIRYNEFMVAKVWLSLASLRDEAGRPRQNTGLELGLYREEGQEAGQPRYKQVDGGYWLVCSQEGRWGLRQQGALQHQEITIQHNPKVRMHKPL